MGMMLWGQQGQALRTPQGFNPPQVVTSPKSVLPGHLPQDKGAQFDMPLRTLITYCPSPILLLLYHQALASPAYPGTRPTLTFPFIPHAMGSDSYSFLWLNISPLQTSFPSPLLPPNLSFPTRINIIVPQCPVSQPTIWPSSASF